MVLYRINDFDPDYRRRLGTQAIVGYQLCNGDRHLGTVDDLLVDAAGQYRYLVIHPGGWLFGKQMLLPIGQAWIDTSTRQVFVSGLTREQVKALPACTAATILDADYEAQVSHVYQRRQRHPSGLLPLEETVESVTYSSDRPLHQHRCSTLTHSSSDTSAREESG